MALADFPRYPLLFGPSPVHPLDRLTAQVLRESNRKGCELRHPCWPDCSFPFHLPFGSEAFWVLLALSEETR